MAQNHCIKTANVTDTIFDKTWLCYCSNQYFGDVLLNIITFSSEKCTYFFQFIFLLNALTVKGKITQYWILLNVQSLLTACPNDGVTLYSRSISTWSSPRSNEPALTSSRLPDDPVYSRTVAVVAAFSSTSFSGRSRRRLVVETAVVVLNCPRHTV